MTKQWIWGMVLLLTSVLMSEPVAAQGFDDGWTMGGCMLSQGQSAEFTREFQANQTYVVLADGLEGAMDVDLEILSSSGRVVTQDTRAAKSATVEFRPAYTGRYTIRVKLASGVGRPICHFVVMVRNGGWNVPYSTALDVLTRFTVASIVAGDELERFYGYIMRPGERNSVEAVGLRGSYTAIAVGSDNAYDLDLVVRRRGVVLARDDMDDNIPICEFFASGNNPIEVEVEYFSGKGAAFVVVGLVRSVPSGIQRL